MKRSRNPYNLLAFAVVILLYVALIAYALKGSVHQNTPHWCALAAHCKAKP